MQGAEGGANGFAGEHQSEESEDVFEALVGSLAQDIIEEGEFVGAIDIALIEKAAAIPDALVDRYFTHHRCIDLDGGDWEFG